VREHARDQRGRLALAAAEPGDRNFAERGDAGSGGLLDGIEFVCQHRGRFEVAAERRGLAPGVRRGREYFERPTLTAESNRRPP